MTDLQKYTDSHDGRLSVHLNPDSDGALILGASIPTPNRGKGTRNGSVIYVPTARLLAMIDAADPEAMRAYLRETAPDFVADTLRPADGPAADHFDYLDDEPTGHTARVTPEPLDQTPVADSPEDVMPDRIDPTERAQLDRAWALDKAVTLFSAGIGSRNAMAVADWIINGTKATDR